MRRSARASAGADFVTALLGFAIVLAAATGAHSVLADIRAADPASPLLRQWDQAILFAFVHVLAALGTAVVPTHERARLIAGWLFVAGVVLFSGIQLARVAGVELPGMFLPVGGVALMAGWVVLAVSALLAKRS
jgi:uncharacterized membrane protein YgdD (TMEM256/DUF423 family)